MTTSNPPAAPNAAPLDRLDGGVFEYLGRRDASALTKLIESLARCGDLPSLRNALEVGCAGGDRVARACALLDLLPFENEHPGLPHAARIALAGDWLAAAAAGAPANFIERVLKQIDELPENELRSRFSLFKQPQFGLAPLRLMPARMGIELAPHESERYEGTSSLVGRSLALGRFQLAFDLLGGPVREFPVTATLRLDDGTERAFHVAEQVVLAELSNDPWVLPALAERLIAPDCDEPWLQLGDVVLRLLDAADACRAAPGAQAADCPYRHSYANGTPSFHYGSAVALVGLGARFRDPACAWQRLHGATFDTESMTTVAADDPPARSFAAIFAYLDPVPCVPELAARMLSRMIKEGGLAPDALDNGQTLLQLAARHGKEKALVALLDAGADPTALGSGKAKQTAAEIATAHGHTRLAEMLHAHTARTAMQSTLLEQSASTRRGSRSPGNT